MPETFNIYDAKTQLSRLVERAGAGEEIIIAKGGKPMARLVGLPREKPKRRPGRYKGQIVIREDFDAPLDEDFERAVRGEGA